MSSNKRLIRDYEDFDNNDLGDRLRLISKNIEDSLVNTGAIPGKDYTYMDLYRMAIQFHQTTMLTEKFGALTHICQEMKNQIERLAEKRES